MYYLAAITDWIEPWGPVGWGAVSIASIGVLLCLITVVRMGFAWASMRRAQNAYAEVAAQNATVNPLQDEFTLKRISLREFYHPYFKSNERKVFKKCEFFGPCNIALTGSRNDLPRTEIRDCEFVIVDAQKDILSAVAFSDCTFIDCSFFRVTFFMNAAMARNIKNHTSGAMHVITDGTYGEI